MLGVEGSFVYKSPCLRCLCVEGLNRGSLRPAAINGMNEGQEDQTTEPVGVPAQLLETAAAVPASARFFQRTDWLTSAMTTVLVFVGYFLALPPEVTFENSGIFSAAAMYGGVAHPPGYPVRSIYGWLFTVPLPVSNIAWRLAVASAVAGALTCGVIALMVSRGGASIVEGLPGFRRLSPKEEQLLRAGCGCVAGLAFGFNGGFWNMAVVVGAWPLSLLLLSIVLCLLMRWLYRPERKRFLYAAIFAYGLTISNSQAMIPAVLGLQFMVMLGDRKFGRDIFCLDTFMIVMILAADRLGALQTLHDPFTNLKAFYRWTAVGTALLGGGLVVKTRGLLTEWKPASFAGIAFLLGAAACLSLPIVSMTNPPVNWGYPRTVEGLFHVLTRGQFERIMPTDSLARYLRQWVLYGKVTLEEFGFCASVIALIPALSIRRLKGLERSWILGLSAVWTCLTLLLVIVLNPDGDRWDFMPIFFSASHLILAVWMGYGLILLGSFLTRPRIPLHSGSESQIKP
ncbi:MAG: hypothetical protein JWR69_3005 [Pedosphaera sp.]|nr:hypothetical protein [Pedosphaera sp.]